MLTTLAARQSLVAAPRRAPSRAQRTPLRIVASPLRATPKKVHGGASELPPGVHKVEHVITHQGKQYIPLSEAQRFFELGIRSGAEERIEMLEKQLEMMEEQRNELAAAMQDEYTVHESEMKKLLTVALGLEAEVEKRAAQVDWAASQAAMDAEARMAEAFAQQLEKMHEMDVAEVKAQMHERIEHMGHALRTALNDKERWRHRAEEAERQLAQLRGTIETKLEGAQQGARIVGARMHTKPTLLQVDED